MRVEDRNFNEPRNSQGLGLVFCRTAIEAHGGTIWVEENQPKGSCFCVRLPRVAQIPERLVSPDKAPPQLVVVASAG